MRVIDNKPECVMDLDKKELNRMINVDTPLIYHYTSKDVLPAFFEDNADLYCTNSKCLNDPSELYLGAYNFIDYLYRKGLVKKEHIRLFISRIDEAVANDWFNVWLMSFTACEDDLSQWRGYVSRSEGGFAIGFNASRLIRALKKLMPLEDIRVPNSIPMIAKCWYVLQDASKIECLYDFMTSVRRDSFMNLCESVKEDSETARKALAAIFPLAMHIKHDAFKDEKESRIALMVTDDDFSKMKILGGKPRMPLGIPSLEVPLHTLIDKIYISPHGNTESLMTLARWLRSKVKGNFEIVRSRIPYDPSR